MYKRLLFAKQKPTESCFILGPRQTGKTTLLQTLDTKIHYDLLESSEFLRLSKDPDVIYRECKKLDQKATHLVWIDEVQKIPKLLDVVHRSMEKFKNIKFLLSGSSARKLKAVGTNLLGGRALNYKFHPLTSIELAEEFELDLALRFGTLPRIYELIKSDQAELAKEYLNAYVTIYLEEEIKRESLVRELPPFQRFLEVAAQCSGNLINFSKISDESQISHTATTNYFSILEDTLIGFFLAPYHKSIRKQLSKQPKFYFFDNGVNRAVLNTLDAPPIGLDKGTMFEQFVVQEVRRINDYYRKNFKLYFWRTESGAEVDLLICKSNDIILAVECKASKHINKRDLSGLKAFKKDYPKVKSFVCAPVEREIEIDEDYSAVNMETLLEYVLKI
jgi:predicted AAA+ superfamily ATPase